MKINDQNINTNTFNLGPRPAQQPNLNATREYLNRVDRILGARSEIRRSSNNPVILRNITEEPRLRQEPTARPAPQVIVEPQAAPLRLPPLAVIRRLVWIARQHVARENGAFRRAQYDLNATARLPTNHRVMVPRSSRDSI
jgi:hypothetical protein